MNNQQICLIDNKTNCNNSKKDYGNDALIPKEPVTTTQTQKNTTPIPTTIVRTGGEYDLSLFFYFIIFVFSFYLSFCKNS